MIQSGSVSVKDNNLLHPAKPNPFLFNLPEHNKIQRSLGISAKLLSEIAQDSKSSTWIALNLSSSATISGEQLTKQQVYFVPDAKRSIFSLECIDKWIILKKFYRFSILQAKSEFFQGKQGLNNSSYQLL